MAKLYVFGIGGTGSRVIRSLTMLLASGIDTGFDIVPILIDPDGAGGDLNRTTKLLREYQDLYTAGAGHKPNKYFKNKITTLGDIITEKGGGAKVFDGFRFELDGVQNDKFKDFIDFNSLDRNNKNLAKLLFSEKNLDADLDVGFKGNPNIGSVVLNQFTKSEVFQSFADTFEANDRIFIISSIFGGTGAAGFPLLVKNLRKANIEGKHYEYLKNSKIGAITVQPYFKVKQNDNSEIDSHGFITKTKAALHYYSKNISGNNSVNHLYYIGDAADNTYENNEGGKNQQNDAHFIELSSALAIIDFAHTDDTYLQTTNGKAIKPKFKEFGINGDNNLSFGNLYGASQNLLKQNLIEYFYFNLFTNNYLKDWLKAPFAKEYEPVIDQNFLYQGFYKTLTAFNSSFRVWIAELSRNSIAFSPFSVNPVVNQENKITDFSLGSNNIFTLVRDTPEKKNLNPFASNNDELFVSFLNKAAKATGNAPDAPKRFLEIFSQATTAVVNKKLI